MDVCTRALCYNLVFNDVIIHFIDVMWAPINKTSFLHVFFSAIQFIIFTLYFLIHYYYKWHFYIINLLYGVIKSDFIKFLFKDFDLNMQNFISRSIIKFLVCYVLWNCDSYCVNSWHNRGYFCSKSQKTKRKCNIVLPTW